MDLRNHPQNNTRHMSPKERVCVCVRVCEACEALFTKVSFQFLPGAWPPVSTAMPTKLVVDTGQDIWKRYFPHVPAESHMGYAVAAWGFKNKERCNKTLTPDREFPHVVFCES